MNARLSTLLPASSVPEAILQNGCVKGPPVHVQQTFPLERLILGLPKNSLRASVNFSYLADNCNRDFDALLFNMVGRLTACLDGGLDLEIQEAFRRVSECLEIKRATLWGRPGEADNFFTLTYRFAARKPRSGESRIELFSANQKALVVRLSQRSSMRLGSKSTTCFPWMSAQVEAGKAVLFSNQSQLPPEATRDKEALALLGIRSCAVIPFRAEGKVLGAASFVLNPADATRPHDLLERLIRATEVLGIGILRAKQNSELQAAVRELGEIKESLSKSYAEIKQLKERSESEGAYLESEPKVNHAHGHIIGVSAGIKRVLHQVEQVAPVECAVLVSGETGTGKELIAQEIHRLSQRRGRPMVLVNCAALPVALVESELFGRERGAYTGALTAQVGRFQIADGSTIFLDEVGELSMEVQAKLLRVLQQGEFQRLGSPKTHKVNVRVVAATNRDLAEEVNKGRFREDLYYRLKVFPIELPPLRKRVEDIPGLVFAFMEEFSTRMGKKITKVPRNAMARLERHSWPGNIRELRNVIEHSVILTSGDVLKLSMLNNQPLVRAVEPETLAAIEREHILKTLEVTGWRIKGEHGAAHRLGLEPSTLYSRMQKLEIPNRRQKDELSNGAISAPAAG